LTAAATVLNLEILKGSKAAKTGEALDQAKKRDAEITSGAVAPRTHEEVMRAARRAIG